MFACLALLLSATVAGTVPDIEVDPAVLEIDADQSAAEVWVKNASDAPWTADATVFTWHQRIDGENLAQAQDLLVSPAHFTVPPQGRQRLRLVRAHTEPLRDEAAYRLVLEQPSDPAAPGTPRLRHSSAIFVHPPGGGARPRLLAEAQGETTRPVLLLHNAGGIHARVTELAWIDPRGQRHLLQAGLAGYVLAGASRRWTLPHRASGYTGGHFQAQINQGRPQVLESPALADAPQR